MKRQIAVSSAGSFATTLRSVADGIRRGVVMSFAIVAVVAVYVATSIGTLLSVGGVTGVMMAASSGTANAHIRPYRHRHCVGRRRRRRCWWHGGRRRRRRGVRGRRRRGRGWRGRRRRRRN